MRVSSALAAIAVAAAVAVAAPSAQALPARLVFAGSGSIYTLAADGTDRHRLSFGSAFVSPEADVAPRWLPDGRHVAWVRFSGGREQVWVMAADGSDKHRVAPNPSPRVDDDLVAITPGGQLVISRVDWSKTPATARRFAIDADGRHAHPISRRLQPLLYLDADFSRDGRRIVGFGPGGLVVARADGSHRRVIARDGEYGRWAPDGERVTFQSDRDRNGATCDGDGCDYHEEIYVIDANGRHRHRLTRSKADDQFPSWSPDGRRIAFQSNRNYPSSESSEIYSVRPDGSCLTWLTNGAISSGEPAWQPGGGSADPHACGPAGRKARLDADTRRITRYQRYPLYWFGPWLPRGIFFSELSAYAGIKVFWYADCSFWTPRRCGRGAGLTNESACDAARAPLEHGRARNYSLRRGALLVSRGLNGLDPELFTGATLIDLNDVEPSVRRLRPYPHSRAVDELPPAAFPDWFWRKLREVEDSFERTHDTRATAHELGIRESAAKRRLALGRRLRKLGVDGRLPNCPEPRRID